MAIAFNQIPAALRVPFIYFENSAGQAPYQSNQRLLLVGQLTATGSATADQPIIVSGGEDALFGAGSMMSIMYKAARIAAPFQEIWCGPVADAAGSTAATATITVTSVPTSSVSMVYYIDGIRIPVTVTSSMTVAQIAAAIVSAINTNLVVLSVIAASVLGVVTLTARNTGTVYNTLRIDTKMLLDDSTAAGTYSTIVQFSGGVGDPVLTNLITNLASEPYEWIGTPYSDTANMLVLTALMDARWGAYSQIRGHVVTARSGTLGTLTTYGATQNSSHTTVLALRNYNSSVASVVGALSAVVAAHLQDAPELSRPLQYLSLPGILGPKLISDKWSITERNSLYYTGLSACNVARDGTVQLDRVTTTYQTNATGQLDQTYLDINTMAQLMYGLAYLGQKLASTWGRSALLDSNSAAIPGFADPVAIADTIIHGYRELEALGVFENSAMFTQLLVVERDAVDPNRINALLPLDHVNQLRVLAAAAVSYLQYPKQ